MATDEFRVSCPECDEILRFRSKPIVGQKLTCRECDVEFVVVNDEPIELEYVLDDDDEWFDDGDGDDDDDDDDDGDW